MASVMQFVINVRRARAIWVLRLIKLLHAATFCLLHCETQLADIPQMNVGRLLSQQYLAQ